MDKSITVNENQNDQLALDSLHLMLALKQSMSNSSLPLERTIIQTGELFQKNFESMQKNFETVTEENRLYRTKLLELESQKLESEKTNQSLINTFHELIKQQKEEFEKKFLNQEENNNRVIRELKDDFLQKAQSSADKISALENKFIELKSTAELNNTSLNSRVDTQKTSIDSVRTEQVNINNALSALSTNTSNSITSLSNSITSTCITVGNVSNAVTNLTNRYNGHVHDKITRPPSRYTGAPSK